MCIAVNIGLGSIYVHVEFSGTLETFPSLLTNTYHVTVLSLEGYLSVPAGALINRVKELQSEEYLKGVRVYVLLTLWVEHTQTLTST